ncbi:Endonuclease-reverse transcriptase HmRTE-e01 [Operophtera brumata]|uniref:Endonuclease-reverse transcriptase HmRTE-e01 n=1 Tax=Operophtera brumata TaxID=104452 RepID=A0A0L7LA26_OPEBR|nr:Endonuclease-reverse transcriptase HmRTE-e01 [Operophtera brumata]
MWRDFQLYCNEKAKQYLGVSKGAINNNKDTSWWNEEVREKLETKKTLFKLWQQTKDDDDHQAYKIAKKIAKRAVAQAKATARDDFYAQLETASNDREIFKLAKRKHQSSRDTATNKFIKNDQGKLLTSNEDIRDRWKEYYTELLNEIEHRRDNSKRNMHAF